jgi:hypothetical protein
MPINKVGSKGIADGSVASADFADCTVSSDKLTDGTVANAKLVNSSVTLAGQSISLGGSVDINLTDWQSVVTADGSTTTTAVSGQGYFIDTTSASHTINLPVSASIGDFVAIKDYAGTFGTNNLTIGRNGHNIQGVANDSLISTNRASLVLVYVDSTKGWLYWEESNVGDLGQELITATGGTVTTSGDFRIHTFTGDGCFSISEILPSSPGNVDYLVVAGGGGSGGYCGFGTAGGAGGAGGYRTTFPSPGCNAGAFPVSATTYPITVGAGGVSYIYPNNQPGTQGSNSVFSTITSAGGGYGAAPPSPGGASGGSGGGGSNGGGGGSGNTPPVSPSQGNNGAPAPGGPAPGGGGGGSGGAGSAACGINGGDGLQNSITGTAIYYSAGGYGRSGASPYPQGSSGTGYENTANRGHGSPRGDAPGSKGIVVLRYKIK